MATKRISLLDAWRVGVWQGWERTSLLNGSYIPKMNNLVCHFEDFNKEFTSNLDTFVERFKLTELTPSKQSELFKNYRYGRQYQDNLENKNLDTINWAAALSQFRNL